jgi:hypothetical protein
MYLNGFSLRIPGAQETGQYVELTNGSQYSVVLRNQNAARCEVTVKIDGRPVGTWRVDINGSITIERPLNDTGKFTFYRSGTTAAEKVGEASIPVEDKGLVQATFTPEKVVATPLPKYGMYNWGTTKLNTESFSASSTFDYNGTNNDFIGCCHASTSEPTTRSSSAASGVTGLSGKSNQEFVTVRALTLDYSKQTLIAVRLVAASNDPRPLVAFSTPIPPPVG